MVSDEIKPLPIRREMREALTHDQKVRLLKTSKLKPAWQNARLATTVALNTTMRSSEIKGLRWRDVNFFDLTLFVRRSTTKTDAGERVIPLNPDAWAAISELWERAKAFGGTDPDHYVFPACENFRFDPSRPIKSWRSAWRSLRKAAGLETFRFHDTRHQAITELAETQASDATIMSVAGHVSHRMLEHYSHVRLETKRQALNALSSRPIRQQGEGGYGTKKVTNGTIETPLHPVNSSKGWSGREDLNLRPPGPEPGALPG